MKNGHQMIRVGVLKEKDSYSFNHSLNPWDTTSCKSEKQELSWQQASLITRPLICERLRRKMEEGPTMKP